MLLTTKGAIFRPLKQIFLNGTISAVTFTIPSQFIEKFRNWDSRKRTKITHWSKWFFESSCPLLLFPLTKFWTANEIWFKILKQHFWCASIELLQIFYFISDGHGLTLSILKCGMFSRDRKVSGQLMISKVGIMLGVAQLGGHRPIFGSPWNFYANKKNWWTTCFWIRKLETALDPKIENGARKMSALKQWNVPLFRAIATFQTFGPVWLTCVKLDNWLVNTNQHLTMTNKYWPVIND